MKQIKYILLIFGMMVGFGLAAIPAQVDAATSTTSSIDDACSGTAADTALCKNRGNDDLPKVAKDIVNTLLYVLGAVSVIVIIVAGIMYTTSSGDPALITKAKNTLLYAVVGLVVAIMAYAIVNYVITQFK